MKYTPIYTKPYPNGWENLPEETTPIKAEALNAIDESIEHIENQLAATTERYDIDSEGKCIISGKELKVCGEALEAAETPNVLLHINQEGNADFKGDVRTGTGISLNELSEKVNEPTGGTPGADIGPATTEAIGLVKPDGTTIKVNEEGTISTEMPAGYEETAINLGMANTKLGQEYPVMVGYNNKVNSLSMAVGTTNEANGENCFAFGYGNKAGSSSSNYSVAIGKSNKAEASNAIAIGLQAEATLDFAIALGRMAKATGYDAISIGDNTSATKENAVAIGNYAKATGNAAFAEGNNTTASGQNSHAEGYQTIAQGDYSHAEGIDTKAYGTFSHVEGNYTEISAGASNSHAEGYRTKVTAGSAAHAEGMETKAEANAAHAEGNYTTASGQYSHTEGNNTTATDMAAHAEGNGTTASSMSAHAEGYGTAASGMGSHAQGGYTMASSMYSHAEGLQTVAGSGTQHVQGKYNVEDTEGLYAHIVGGGTEKERKNIHTLDWEGNADFAGDVRTGTGISLNELAERVGGSAGGTPGGDIGPATTEALGLVKPDGITIKVNEEGTISTEMPAGNVDIWKPNVSTDGILTWQRSADFEAPAAVNIKGEPGGAYTEADKAELEQYIDTKFQALTGDLLGGAS